MATPALRAIRETYSSAKIAWVAKPYVLGALQGSNWCDEIVPSGHAKGMSKMFEPVSDSRAIVKKLGGKPDLAVLFSNSLRTGLTAWLTGAKRRVGQNLHGRGFLLTDSLSPYRGPDGKLAPYPILSVYNQIARQAGCADPGLKMELFTSPQDEAAADQAWKVAGFTSTTRVVGIHAGAAFGAAKLWPPDRFAWVASKLAEKGIGTIVIGGPAEAQQARELVGLACHPLVKALAESGMPPLSLGLSKAVVRRLALLLTTDSGPRHFASALGRPVVTLYGPTHIAWTETWQENAYHMAAPVPCGPCQQRVCPLQHHNCMKHLGASMVLQVVETILDGKKPTVAPKNQPGVRDCDPPRVLPLGLDNPSFKRRRSA